MCLVVVRPEELDMDAILKSVVSSIGIKFKQAGVRVGVSKLPRCFADKEQVTQIFRNLLDNAVKYLDAERGGQICVSGEVRGGEAIYCVADNGIGIGLEDQEKVFEIFTRLVEKAHAGGEGMGLAMVKRMVDRNNGKVWVVSEKGKGSEFFVALPVQNKK